MTITILTMFPEYFESFLSSPIPRRAAQRGIAKIELVDIKEYAGGCYRHIDDSTFGGGAGMVLRAKPVLDALSAVRAGHCDADGLSEGTCGAAGTSTLVAALTPVGPLHCQETARRYARLDHLILICGHYEGMDERIYAQVDERISIGDYVLSGGEPAAQVVTDSVLRLLPGVLRPESTQEESFCGRGLLEYPQYTRPSDLTEAVAGAEEAACPQPGSFRVPDVLLSGNHDAIRRWRLKESLRATRRWRPDLLEKVELTQEEQGLLEELQSEDSSAGNCRYTS